MADVTHDSRPAPAGERSRLLRRGLWLEYATLGWNVVGVAVLAVTALAARSVALAAFGFDSLVEIVASTVVVWQLRGTDAPERTRLALRTIAVAFALLGLYIAVQAAVVLAQGNHPGRSVLGAVWLGVTAVAMFVLARGKAETGRRLDNEVLRTEARITLVDGLLASAVLLGVLLNAAAGVWWADPVAALVLVAYAAREVRHAWIESTMLQEHRETAGRSA